MNKYKITAAALEVIHQTKDNFMNSSEFYDYKEYVLRQFYLANDISVDENTITRERLFHHSRALMKSWRKANHVLRIDHREGRIFVQNQNSTQEILVPKIDLNNHNSLTLHSVFENFLDQLNPKFEAFIQILNAVRPQYNAFEDDGDEANFMETVIGAAIFYLPNSVNEHWDRKISLRAFKKIMEINRSNNGKVEIKGITRDHKLPRKRSARLLLKNQSIRSARQIRDLYVDELSKFRYLTPQENRSLINYEQDSYDLALAERDIQCFPVNGEFHDLAQLKDFIRHLIENNINNIDLEVLEREFNEFNREAQ